MNNKQQRYLTFICITSLPLFLSLTLDYTHTHMQTRPIVGSVVNVQCCIPSPPALLTGTTLLLDECMRNGEILMCKPDPRLSH